MEGNRAVEHYLRRIHEDIVAGAIDSRHTGSVEIDGNIARSVRTRYLVQLDTIDGVQKGCRLTVIKQGLTNGIVVI